MSSEVRKETNCSCLLCGSTKLTVLYEDYTGYVTQSAHCAECGYSVIANAGCGAWSDADWSVSRKEGVLAVAWASDDEPGYAMAYSPASRQGAEKFVRNVQVADDAFIYALFVSDTEVHPIAGDPPFEDEEEAADHIWEARQFLARIQLKTEFPELE